MTVQPEPGQRIEDYALIGDCETAALVGRDGSIDWLCWPRFDSPACFAALLGGPEYGRWLITSAAPPKRVSRSYRGGSLILTTTLETETGVVEIVDFMPPRDGISDLVRLVRGVKGEVAMRTELIVRLDYGAIVPWVERLEDGALCAIGGPDMVVLRAPVELRGEGMTTVGDFVLRAGDSVPFVLSYGPSHQPPARPIEAEPALKDTEAFWRDWSDRCTPAGPWTDAVKQSLAVLKGLTYAPTGGLVAAATTSLPEQPGGVRNWDYRFCWLRDATLTLLALMHAGYYEEAQSWRDWLVRAVAGSPDDLQIMYGVAGERRLTELELPWLPGYQGARPVRIGNLATTQRQLDVFGEVADALYQAEAHGIVAVPRAAAIHGAFLDRLEKIWHEPDEGMWEVRGPPQHFTHSKVMAWVAFDRAVKSVTELGIEGPVERWQQQRDEIHADICRQAFDPELGSFVQAYGSKALDASLLQLPLVGFLPPEDPRIVGTVHAIEHRLLHDGLVLRYDTGLTEDGLPPGEGAFLACSFWLADNMIMQGRVVEAHELFERLLALRNDVGLLAEEYDPRSKRQLGNFPQAFSHIALINTALNLTRAEGPAERRAGRDGTGKPAETELAPVEGA